MDKKDGWINVFQERQIDKKKDRQISRIQIGRKDVKEMKLYTIQFQDKCKDIYFPRQIKRQI